MSDCGLTGLTFKRPSLVKPQFAEECDLKGIVKRFLKTGQLPSMTSREEISVDAARLPGDFQTLMDQNLAIRQEFDLLPLEERNKYNNDPEAWAAEQIAKADNSAQPAQPEPAQPEPAQPEPAQPEPAQPEPAQPEA